MRPLARLRRLCAHRLRDEERGQILLLGLGTACLVLALVLVSASASAVYLDLKTLSSMADSAAAAGAGGVGEGSYYGGESGGAVPGALSPQEVREAARDDVLAQREVVDAVGLSGVEIVSVGVQEGRTAVVVLRAHSQPPFLPWGILPSRGFTITATGTATITTAR